MKVVLAKELVEAHDWDSHAEEPQMEGTLIIVYWRCITCMILRDLCSGYGT